MERRFAVPGTLLACAALAFPAWGAIACGGQTGDAAGGNGPGAGGGSGTTGGQGGAPANSTGGTNTGAGGDEGAPWLADPELEALDTSDNELAATSGAELLELAAQIGLSRGRALCTCLGPVTDDDEWLASCAAAETGYPGLIGSDL